MSQDEVFCTVSFNCVFIGGKSYLAIAKFRSSGFGLELRDCVVCSWGQAGGLNYTILEVKAWA